MRTFLVTGTDTGVGKTFVGARLAAALSSRGLAVVAVKPAETGAGDAIDPAEDGAQLARATGQRAPRAALVRLRTPVAPPVAAEREGVALALAPLVRDARALAQGADALLIEGAGGLLSPLVFEPGGVRDVLDFAQALTPASACEVVLVAPDRLGVLSHVRAARAVLAARGFAHRLTLLVEPEVPDASTGTNAASLGREPHADAVMTVPWARVAATFDAALARAVDALLERRAS